MSTPTEASGASGASSQGGQTKAEGNNHGNVPTSSQGSKPAAPPTPSGAAAKTKDAIGTGVYIVIGLVILAAGLYVAAVLYAKKKVEKENEQRRTSSSYNASQ